MLFTSQIVTKASGSIGGITASHNRFGQYFRARVTPVNPSTAFQIAVRAALTTLAIRWQTLTATQRLAWETYAENVPVVNRVGDTVVLTGLNQYIRSNVPRIQNGLVIVDDGPTTFSLPDFTTPSIVLSVVAGFLQASITFTDTDGWAIADGGALLNYGSRELALSIEFFKGPFKVGQPILGAITPPTSPQTSLYLQTATTGNKAFIRFRATEPDGRLSASLDLQAVIG